MGYDCGFDIHPRLEANALNKAIYQKFLDEVIKTFICSYDEDGRRDDGKILDLPDSSKESQKNLIQVMIGECPAMPSNPEHCNYFLRFSSKISGGLTAPAEPYIRHIRQIATKHFGVRVHFWHEMCETGDEKQYGFYSWTEVHDAAKELRALGSEDGEKP
ncbi:hypothetical protein J3F83DRAFT_726463 [Trichoderma novae-zelandiae]